MKCPACDSEVEITYEQEGRSYWKVSVCSNIKCGKHLGTVQVSKKEWGKVSSNG